MVRKELIVRTVGEADHLLAALRASAARAQAWVASQSGDPLDLLRRMKFEQVGFHPLEDRPLNISNRSIRLGPSPSRLPLRGNCLNCIPMPVECAWLPARTLHSISTS